MVSAIDSVNPERTIATPVTSPQMVVAIKVGAVARKPSRNASQYTARPFWGLGLPAGAAAEAESVTTKRKTTEKYGRLAHAGLVQCASLSHLQTVVSSLSKQRQENSTHDPTRFPIFSSTPMTAAATTPYPQAFSQTPINVDPADLPLTCPGPHAPLWSMHPRVFLDFDQTGAARCPYCGAEYHIQPGATVRGH